MGNRFEIDLNEIIDVGGTELEQIVRSRVLITGGSGFVGRWVVSALAKCASRHNLKGHVVSVSRSCPIWQQRLVADGHTNYAYWDVSQSLPRLGAFGYVFHGAVPASAKINHENPLMMRETIDLGTSQLMATFAETKTRITHLSSGAVYGTQPKDTASFSEEWSDNPSRVVPDSEYHQGKIRAEQRMNEEASDSQVVHARLFAFIAPYLPLDTHFAAGNFINAALRGEPLRVTGNPQTVRTYMYGIDLVLWLIRIALRGENKRAYNVGSDDPVTIGELASRIANQSKNRVDVEIVPQNTTSVEINRYIPNISRSRSELGLEIRIQLDEAIRRTLEWGYESV